MSRTDPTRRTAIFACIFAAISTLCGGGTASTQEALDGCKTFTHRYYLSAGTAITVQVGFVDTALLICRDGSGWIRRAGATQTTGTTGPGALAGFVVEPSLSVVTEQTGTVATARYQGRVRICLPQRTNLCSKSNDYEISAEFSPVGPTLDDRFRPRWGHGKESPGGVQYHEDARS